MKQNTEEQQKYEGDSLSLPSGIPEGFQETRPEGLTDQEAAELAGQGKSNRMESGSGKTIPGIIFSNVFTLFNFLNLALALCLLAVGSYRNMTFMVIIIANTLISIIQEIRAKKTIEKMQLLNTPKVHILRGGQERTCAPEESVAGDLIVLRAGDQVAADSLMISGRGSAMESLLTGESDAVPKERFSWLYSGSYVTEGRIVAQQVYVGDESYAGRLRKETRKAKRPESGLIREEQKLIRWDSFILIPLGILLFLKQAFIMEQPLTRAVPSSVAAMIGMIPEGLILLTSVALVTGVVRLARRKVLVQELCGIETLARTDVLCLDKTGTITSGRMHTAEIIPLEAEESGIREALAALLSAFDERSGTLEALRSWSRDGGSPEVKRTVSGVLPFSSERKKSAVSFTDGNTLILGAPEFVLGRALEGELKEKAEKELLQGRRVVLLAAAEGEIRENQLPKVSRLLAFFALEDELRPHAEDTVRYFREQGVTLKVISGDNPATVSRIARQAGIADWDQAVDASTLQTEEQMLEACERYTVFGRVTPGQKKQLVEALKKKGHSVGMTGDGVNDIPAMKAADCSIAMAEGTDAARHAAQLTLLESDFGVVPGIVLEGRRVINNITRSASLFLTKTIFSMLLSVLLLILPGAYPFQPIQMSLVSSMTVGIPGFFLAMEPCFERIRGKFLKTVISRALPGGLAVTICSALAMHLSVVHPFFTQEVCSTVATWVTGLICVLVLWRACVPMTPLRRIVVAGSAAGFSVLALTLRKLFFFVSLGLKGGTAVAALTALGGTIVFLAAWVMKKKGIQT